MQVGDVPYCPALQQKNLLKKEKKEVRPNDERTIFDKKKK